VKTIGIALMLMCVFACTHQKNKQAYSPTVSFQEDDKTFEGNISLPEKFKKKIPLVIIVHEWWGKTPYIKSRAKMLTKEGFAAMTVDLYGNGKTVDTPKEAQALATPFYQNPELGVRRLNKFIGLAKNDPHIASDQIYVIGYCFGGTQALNLARSGKDIAGVVSFHGGLSSSYPIQNRIKTDILVLNGAADPMVPVKDVKAFEEEMKKAKADYKIIHYKNATHAFTNPRATEIGKKNNMPIAYSKEADEASWRELLKFLRQ
jgi:dienelactone hydrolase